MRSLVIGFAIITVVISGRAVVLADVINIGPSKDATIYGGSTTINNSNGSGPGMFSGTDNTTPTPAPTRALIRFNLAGNVPAGATISNVQLILALGMVAGGGGSPGPTTVSIDLHKLTADWGEGTTGSSSTTIGGTGGGFAANAGDATWNARMFGSTLWTSPGGDFSGTVSATASVANTLTTTSNNVFYTWGSTANLVADVQSWLDNPSSNFGWALVNTDETSAKTFRAFYTREFSTAALRPQLQITYAVPEPSGLILGCFLFGGVLLFRRSGRRRDCR